MKFCGTSFGTLCLLSATITTPTTVGAFVPSSLTRFSSTSSSITSTGLYAIGILAKKAKEATLREYIAGGIEDSVMEQYKIIQAALSATTTSTTTSTPPPSVALVAGPLQQALTRRKGTITVIAEYKRKVAESGYIKDSTVLDPDILSPEFREFGAAGIAVMADERMGGCTYQDLKIFVEDQRRAKLQVPGPVPIINNDLIVDELQIAQSAAYGCKAVVLTWNVVGPELCAKLLLAARAVQLEVIVAVSTKEEAQLAIDLGATMISVVNAADVESRVQVITDLVLPEQQQPSPHPGVTMIANINARQDKGLAEVEEAWACRDQGFHCVWVSDVLYKSGNQQVEHPGAILRAITAKSSLRWASPQARSGRGEGAREYLGDIMM
jgi:indole-3-glycerol phosphate synthase